MRNDCEYVRTLLPDYLEQNLEASVQAEVEQHLTTCAECQRECRALEQVPLLLRAWSPDVPANALWWAIQAKRSRTPVRLGRLRWALVGSAVAGLALIAVWQWYRPPAPPPKLTQIDTEPIFRAHLDWAPHSEAVNLDLSLSSGGATQDETR